MRHLVSLLFRIAAGERREKATDTDYRQWFGYFFFAGVFMLGGISLARGFFDRVSILVLWLSATVVISIMAFGLVVWVRRVPAAVSLVLGIITWGVFVWLALRETHIL